MDRLSKELHQEYHDAERRAMEKVGVKEITQSQRAIGIVAYLSCCAVGEIKEE